MIAYDLLASSCCLSTKSIGSGLVLFFTSVLLKSFKIAAAFALPLRPLLVERLLDPLSFSDRATPDRAWRCPGLTAPFSGTCMDPSREIYAGARLCHTLSLDRALTCLFVGTCGNLSGTCGELVCLFVGTRGYSFIDKRLLGKFFY